MPANIKRVSSFEGLADRDWMWEHYIEKGMTRAEIGEKVGCATTTVSRWISLHGLVGKRKRRLPTTCTFEGCDRPYRSKGYCEKHYLRLYRHGDASTTKQFPNGTSDEVKFWTWAGKAEGCWLWTGGLRGGYGFLVSPREQAAHRLSWIIHNGPIPVGLQVHHICGIRRCVNPDHLQLVTQRENMGEMLLRRSMEARISHLETENESLKKLLAVLLAGQVN